MLVKLGKLWIDPHKVESLNPQMDSNTIVITSVDGVISCEGNVDEFAGIINNALSTQSFGGVADEEKSSVPF